MNFEFVSEHREYLKRELESRRYRRPLYSQRAFARDLEISPSSLTDYFKGRIRLSPGRVLQLSKKIGLTVEQRQHWVDLINMKYAKSQELQKVSELRVSLRIQSQQHSISVDQFKVIADWYHLAYLQLIMMNTEKYSNLHAGATALGVSVRTLRIAIKRLESLKLLWKESTGFYATPSTIKLGDSIPSLAVQQFHQQMIKKASEAIAHQPTAQRFVSTTMVALPKSEVEKILVDIKTLAMRYLNPYMNANKNIEKDSMYCLTLQFFDLLSERKA